MKRLHVHNRVSDIERSVSYYTALFGQPPSVRKDDYAKWMIDDPAVNFAVSTRGAGRGIDHLGFQFDSDRELADFRARAERAGDANRSETDTVCCYARSDKHWSTDPDGLAWEGFRTMMEAAVYRESDGRCCAVSGNTAEDPPERACGRGG